jgi:hypothetical protein
MWTTPCLCCTLLWMTAQDSPAPRELSYAELLRRIVDLERLAEPLVPGETCKQFSSYDRRSRLDARTGRYVDWKANVDYGNFLRRDPEGFVLAEMDGPGCIVRIWSANPAGDLLFFVDHRPEPRWTVNFKELIEGKAEPFGPPLVGYQGRGANCFVPIPYQDHCRVVSTAAGYYYHVDYVTFPQTWEVPWFYLPLDMGSSETLWLTNNLLANYAEIHRSARLYQRTEEGTVSVEPGQTKDLLRMEGPRVIKSLRIRVTAASEDALADALRKTILRIVWDDEAKPAVLTPIGDFFGTGPGFNAYQSVPMGTDGEWFYCHWVMPFRASARIGAANHGDQPVTVDWEIGSSELPGESQDALYFHARWRRSYPNKEFDWPILECGGTGRYVGCALSVWNPITEWWGEGDEKVWVDDEAFPSWFGTGSEDYFGDAWGNRVFQHGLHNCTRQDGPGFGQYTALNRWHLSDAIPFQQSFRMTIENYGETNEYAAVAYWYAGPDSTDFFEPIEPDELVVRPWQRIEETEVESVSHVPYELASESPLADSAPVASNRWEMKSDPRRGALSKGSAMVLRSRTGEHAELGLRITPGGPCWLRFRGDQKGQWGVSANRRPVPFQRDGSFLYVGPFEAEAGVNPLTFQALVSDSGVCELILDTLVIDRPDKGPAVEAEDLDPANVDNVTVSIMDQRTGYGCSGWQALAFTTTGEGSFDLKVPVSEDGVYRVAARVEVGTAGTRVSCRSGDVQGPELGPEADTDGVRRVELMRVASTNGFIPVHFTVDRDPSAESETARFVLDSFVLRPVKDRAQYVIEFESMKSVLKTRELTVEREEGSERLSGSSQLLGRCDGPEAAVTLQFEPPSPGVYRAALRLTKSPDYGKLRIVLDGRTILSEFDGYAPQPESAEPIDLGNLALPDETHRITVLVLDKAADSTGYGFGLDCLQLTAM